MNHRAPLDLRELRRRAERALRDRDLPSKLNLDPIRLLHELQVHQVELEVQNEELLSTNRDLDVLRMRYQTLYESAPVGYLMLSETGVVRECNAMALQMLSVEPRAVHGHRLRHCFDPASRPRFDALLDVGADGTSSSDELLLLLRPKRLPMYVRAQTRRLQLPDNDEPLLLFVMMDMSALKYALDDITNVVHQRSLGKMTG